MPSNLTDVDSFDTVTGPIGTDIRNAASVRSALQTLANRTRYLFNRATQVLADFAALKAIDTTSLPDGTTRIVKGQGVYSLDTASGASELQPFTIAPTTGPGRWISATAHLTSRTIAVYPAHALIGVQENGVGTVPGAASLGTSIAINSTNLTMSFGALKWASLGSGSSRNWAFVSLDPYVLEGATLTSAVLYLDPAAHASLPQQMPALSIVRSAKDASNGLELLLAAGSAIDNTATVGAYNAAHTITFTPDQNNVISKSSYGYMACIGDESGGLGVFGGLLQRIDLTFTTPDARGT